MPIIEYEFSQIFSSDPANGALAVSSDGSSFEVQLNLPITIPREAVNATCECTTASIWFNSPNISALRGNNVFRYIIAATPFSFVISDGLYSVSALNNLISNELLAAGHNADDIFLTGNSATQKSEFIFNNAANVQVDFTLTDTPFELIGFTNRLVPLAPSVVGQIEDGDVVANFNAISEYLISTSLVNNGIPVNQLGRSVIANVSIGATLPGNLISFQPQNPLRTSIRDLIGHQISSFNFRLTDQQGVNVETLTEFYSLALTFRYWLKIPDHVEQHPARSGHLRN